MLGSGWEGEVYRVIEQKTGIQRAAKLFYPHRNIRDRAVKFYARKLDLLRKCAIAIQYHHSIAVRHRGVEITCLVSEYVDGELMSDFIRHQPGHRMRTFEALHLLHALVIGIEEVHRVKEYHGDLHSENVLVKRRGIGFDVRVVDFFHRGATTREKRREDIVDVVRMFYDALGGRRWYPSQPPCVRTICRGMRSDLILRRFPTIVALRDYLDSFEW
jgi:tRNA A-37 threonylcarbamoyl transferase component Bud32